MRLHRLTWMSCLVLAGFCLLPAAALATGLGPPPRATRCWSSPRASRRSTPARRRPPCMRFANRRRRRLPSRRHRSASAFTESNLERYRAVVFLNTAGDVLDAAQQAAFESYYTDGGGFLGVHSAIETEPDWQFLTDVLGTRATGASAAAPPRRSRSPTACTRRARTLPEYWTRSDRWLQLRPPTSAASRTCSPRSTRRTYAGGTMGVGPSDRLVQGLPGRPLVLHRPSATRAAASTAQLRAPPRRRDPVGRRPRRPGLQRLRRDRAGQLPADQDLGRRRTSTSRSASTCCPTAA